ncbi:OmpA family protein [Flavobacteriaceae bacterium D16]|nr:OmpA family protein [Flavobacteriaceae bacterium D16]
MILQKTKYTYTIIFFLVYLLCHAQNLVKNPSFEQFEQCPVKLGNLDADVVQWSTPTLGSTDYFHSCSVHMGTPKNFNGEQAAKFGSGYAGLYLYAPDDYREYLQGELITPLTKGERYELSFYISLAERSDFAIREFGVLFSDKPLNFATKKNISNKVRYRETTNRYHYFRIPETEFLKDTRDWVEVRTTFEAKGMERYMILGNFENNARTLKTKRKRVAKQGAYYYLDRVSLVNPEKPLVEIAVSENTVEAEEVYELGEEHTFKNLLFEFDQYELDKAAKKEVLSVYAYLKKHPGYYITVHGHTDNVGRQSYNRILSEKRSQAVARELIRLGLSKTRITWSGKGREFPIASNDTEIGRQQNRRVSFILNKR